MSETPAPQEFIDHVPGVEPFDGQPPTRDVIRIPEDQVTPEMRANALNSPYRVGAGVLRPAIPGEQVGVEAEQPNGPGESVVASEVQIVPSEPEQSEQGIYTALLKGEAPIDPDVAPVRPEVSQDDANRQWVEKQIALNRAAPYGATASSQELPPENK